MRILLDEVISHPLPQRPREIEVSVELPAEAGQILRSAGVPVGLIGYIVQGSGVLEFGDLVTSSEPLQLYGIYDGG